MIIKIIILEGIMIKNKSKNKLKATRTTKRMLNLIVCK
jgi:hypothetical protein